MINYQRAPKSYNQLLRVDGGGQLLKFNFST